MKYEVHLKNVEKAIEINADKFQLIRTDIVWFYAFETGKSVSTVKSAVNINLETADAVFAYDAVLWIQKITE